MWEQTGGQVHTGVVMWHAGIVPCCDLACVVCAREHGFCFRGRCDSGESLKPSRSAGVTGLQEGPGKPLPSVLSFLVGGSSHRKRN